MTANDDKGSWVTYRPDIKILDCTVRDGGLINDHHFSDDVVRSVYSACVAAGVDYMEIGYKASKRIFARDDFGDWKFSDEDDIRRIVGDNPSNMKISVIADAERTDYHTDILPCEDSVIDCVRIACYIHQIPLAIDMVKDAHDKGYETTLNLMAGSTVQNRELEDALEALMKSPVDVIYIVDSFGAFYSEQIRELVDIHKTHIADSGKKIGIHAHNNQQLAYANTIEALISGVSFLDTTINGMGRGAGNCSTELMIGFLKNPKYRLRPILDCIQNTLLPLRNEMEWGYQVPYLVTGILNQHPRAAIKLRGGDTPNDFVGFYDQMVEEE